VVKGKFRASALLGPDIYRVGHAMSHGVAIPAKAHNVLDKKPAGLDGTGVVAMKTPRRIVHEGVRVSSPFSYGGYQDDPEGKAAEADPFNSS